MKDFSAAGVKKPRWPTAAVVTAVLTIGMIYVRLAVYPHRYVPLAYALPLLVGLWHRDRVLLWAMAVCFLVLATVKAVLLIPGGTFDNGPQEYLFAAMQLLNVVVSAGVVHVVLVYRDRLEQSNDKLAIADAELEASNERLAAREVESTRQFEELQSQGEECELQAEELRTQAEELHVLNEELATREKTLQTLLHLSGPATSERDILRYICSAGMELLGVDVLAVAILERSDGQMVVRSNSGFGLEEHDKKLPADQTLAGMALERMQVAQLEDTQLRPDLEFPGMHSTVAPRSILSVPMTFTDGASATLEAYASRPRAWTQEQIQLLQWLAWHCSKVWESVRLRDECRRQQALLQTLADAIPQLAWMAEPDGSIFWYNRRWYEYTGTTPEQMKGWGWQGVHDPQVLPQVLQQWNASIDSGKPFDMTFPLRGADGEFRPFLTRVVPLVDEDGCVLRWFGTNTDVSEQKYTEEVLKTEIADRIRAEERTVLLSEVTAQLLATEQPQQLVESLCRRIMAHLDCHLFFNFLVDETAGRLHLNACAGIPTEAARQIEWLDFGAAVCGCVAQNGYPIVVEHVQTTTDPRAELVRTYGVQAYACHPLMNQGQVIGTLSFGSRTKTTFAADELAVMKAVANKVAIAMQRLRLLEAVQQRAAEAEEANEAKNRFIANISHELRTPMNAILGMINLAVPRVTDPTARDFLETAEESADLLLALLNDLLDCAKLESGKLQLEPETFSLRLVMEQTTRALSVRASAKGLTFACRTPPDMPDALVGDGLRLRQILFNLAGNAIKFTERGGIEIRGRELSRTADETCLEFAVCDTGIGITQPDLDRIFQPFVQADSSTARRFGGTGLGLSIAASLVAMMGGRIWAESELGQGSTFYFTVRLPLAADLPANEESSSGSPALPFAPLRILLVEDNPANQKVAAYILRDRGHLVDIANDGQEALRMTAEDTYDAILMDVQMPGMDGMQTTAAIRKREEALGIRDLGLEKQSQPEDSKSPVLIPNPQSPIPSRHVPIIAMTAHAMNGDRERCLAAGMDGYLSKPIDAVQMFAAVERLAFGSSAARTNATSPTLDRAVAASEAVTIFDRKLALEQCCDNQQLLSEMVGCLFEETDRLFPQLHAALDRADLKEVGDLAHRLKGTLVYLGARSATDAVLAVEACGSKGDAEDAVKELELQVDALKQALTAYRTASHISAD